MAPGKEKPESEFRQAYVGGRDAVRMKLMRFRTVLVVIGVAVTVVGGILHSNPVFASGLGLTILSFLAGGGT